MKEIPRQESNSSKKELEQQVLEEYDRSHKRYGSPRIKAELNKKGISVSLKMVAKIMRLKGLKSIFRKPYFVSTTDSNHTYKVSNNLLNCYFSASFPSQKWVSDMTYIPTNEGWLYVTTVMDLFNRKIIGWPFSSEMTTLNTIAKALQMAFVNRPPGKGLLFHPDRGIQYASEAFRHKLSSRNITQSMNNYLQCCFAVLEQCTIGKFLFELACHETFRTRRDAESAIFDFIEIWYNRKRIHSFLNYQTPCGKEMEYLKQ